MVEFNEDLADVALSNLPAKSGLQPELHKHFSNHKGNSSHVAPLTSGFGTGLACGTSPLPNAFSSTKRPRDHEVLWPKAKPAAGQPSTGALAPSSTYQQDTFRKLCTNASQQAKSCASQTQATKPTKAAKPALATGYHSGGSTGPQGRRQHATGGSTEQFNTFLNQNLFKKS